MKRQQSLASFFPKKPKLEQSPPPSELALEDPKPSQASPRPPHQLGESSKSSIESPESEIEINLPDCWNVQQFRNFQEKFEGLEVSNKKLGCKYCGKHDFSIENGVHVSKGWKHFEIEASGENKIIQQATLQKNMREHFKSKAHTICRENVKQGEQDAVTKGIDKMSEKHIGTTCNVFKTIYSLAKWCKPFSYMKELIDLQTENGLDLGNGLHSRATAVKVVECIANEIRTKLFTSIIEQNLKICLIIDEASTVSCKQTLIVFIKVEDSETPPTIFVELVELKKQDAETICSSVLESLGKVGFTQNYLQNHLIAFCSDGASVMLGRKSGVSTRMAKEFPNIVIWHCLNHRLQLVLDDSINDIMQLNHFKIFLDKIHNIFHKSYKSYNALCEISEQLEIEIIKIGRVLGPRWAACSLRAALAVWRAYPALHQYFHANKKYSSMAARLENTYFFNDLALMIDILEEIALLSNALQASHTDIITAEKLVTRSMTAFEQLRKEKGPYERKVDELITSESFKNIKFVENHRFIGLHRERLLDSIITNMKKRLMDCEHLKTGSQLEDTTNKLQFLNVLEPAYWDIAEVVVPWRAAEDQLRTFGDVFNYSININDYRDFVENVLKDFKNYAIPDSIKKAKDIVRTIAVSSAEAERVFSKMNLLCSESKSPLTISHLTNLLTISVNGLPLPEWDPVPAVKRWLRAHRHTAHDPRLEIKKRGSEESARVKAMWKHLKVKDY